MRPVCFAHIHMAAHPGGFLTAFPSLRLVASGLAVRRGPRFLFRGLDVSLASGQVMQLTGPNGSGKSTLLRLLAGFSPPDAGMVRLEGAATSTQGHSCIILAIARVCVRH